MSINPDFSVTQRLVVGISDMAVANGQNVILSTYALGSCVGLLAFDPISEAAGLIHIMLPKVGTRSGQQINPCMFVDTGLPVFFDELMGVRALKSRLKIALLGGASVNKPVGVKSFFHIGEDNVEAVHTFLREAGYTIHYEDVGGTVNRTVHFSIGKQVLSVRKPTGTDEIKLG